MPLFGLSDEEAEDRAIPLDRQELVPRTGGPALHVGLGRGIVREHFENLARGHRDHGLADFQNRHRTKQPETIDFLVWRDDGHSREILTLTPKSGNRIMIWYAGVVRRRLCRPAAQTEGAAGLGAVGGRSAPDPRLRRSPVCPAH